MPNQQKIVQALILAVLAVVVVYAIIRNGATSVAKEYYCKIENGSLEYETDDIKRQEIFETALNLDAQNCERKFDKFHIENDNKSIVMLKQLQQLNYFIDVTLGKLKELGNFSKEVQAGIKSVEQLRNLAYSDVLKMDESRNMSNYRKVELTKIMNTIQQRILQYQFPADCKKAKKIRCFVPARCGFGCHFHTFAGCLIDGYALKRVVILQNWDFRVKFEEIFQPITNCTLNDIIDPSSNFSKGMNNLEVVNDSVIYADIRINLPSAPFAFPTEFALTLLRLHPNPPVFFIGQFMQYLMRFQPEVQKIIDAKMTAIKFNTDKLIAGIHVRRTNKVNREAERFEIENYMKHVDDWFELQNVKHGKVLKKRLLLTTEDAAVINETLKMYPDYEILYDTEGILQADANRWSGKGLHTIVSVLHMLSRCDFVVCTHSSNMCRFAYELMQITHIDDITVNLISLDTIYYWYGSNAGQHVVKLEHKPEQGVNAANGVNEIELKIGDIIDIDTPVIAVNRRNYFDGLSYGRNLRTGQHGKYPTYKVKEKWKIVDF